MQKIRSFNPFVIMFLVSNQITCLLLGPVAQSVLSPMADPGFASSILARSHTFVEAYRLVKLAQEKKVLLG